MFPLPKSSTSSKMRGSTNDSQNKLGDRSRIPPIRNYTIDLTNLDSDEKKHINDVIMRDIAFNQVTEERVHKLKNEMKCIRKAGALKSGDKAQDRICRRCKYIFWNRLVFFADRGQRCMGCTFRVCKKCRQRQPNGLFLCTWCRKHRQEKWLTGDWFHRGDNDGLHGSDLMRASLRDLAYSRGKAGGGGGGSGKNNNKNDSKGIILEENWVSGYRVQPGDKCDRVADLEDCNRLIDVMEDNMAKRQIEVNATVSVDKINDMSVDETPNMAVNNKHIYDGYAVRRSKRFIKVEGKLKNTIAPCQTNVPNDQHSNSKLKLHTCHTSYKKHAHKYNECFSSNNNKTLKERIVKAKIKITKAPKILINLGCSPTACRKKREAITEYSNKQSPNHENWITASKEKQHVVDNYNCPNETNIHQKTFKTSSNPTVPRITIGNSPTLHLADIQTGNISGDKVVASLEPPPVDISKFSLDSSHSNDCLNAVSSATMDDKSISLNRENLEHSSSVHVESCRNNSVVGCVFDDSQSDHEGICDDLIFDHQSDLSVRCKGSNACAYENRRTASGDVANLVVCSAPGCYSPVPVRASTNVNFNFQPHGFKKDQAKKQIEKQRQLDARKAKLEEQLAEKRLEEQHKEYLKSKKQGGTKWDFLTKKKIDSNDDDDGPPLPPKPPPEVLGTKSPSHRGRPSIEMTPTPHHQELRNTASQPSTKTSRSATHAGAYPLTHGPRYSVSCQTLTKRRKWWCFMCPYCSYWCEFGGY